MAPPTATYTESEVTPQIADIKLEGGQRTLAGQKGPVRQIRPSPPKFEDKYEEREYLKGRLAAAFRIFGKEGFDEGVAGHITLRDPVEPETFWVNPFGVAFSLINKSDLIRVDKHGKVIEGGEVRLLNVAAFMIHHAIHVARPDVVCAAHSHSIYGRAFSTLGKKLDTITQDSCAFHNDLVVYDSFHGVVLEEEEGIHIAERLGPHKAALLQNHGILTVGQSVEAAVFWYLALEKCCRAQLLADAAGPTKKIPEDEAVKTFKTIGGPGSGWFGGKPAFDVIHKETNGEYLL